MRNRINVGLVVDRVIATDGPHRNVEGTVKALAARADVSLKVLCAEAELGDEILRRVDLRRGFEPHNLLRAPANLWKLWREMAACEVLYVPSGLKCFLYCWLLKGKRPLVAGPNVSGIPWLMNPYNPSPLMTVRMADAWIEMSEVRVRRCLAGGTPRERIHLVPHCVDTEHFSPAARDWEIWRKYGIEPGATIIVCTGRVHPMKGIAELVDAFLRIKAQCSDAVLVLLGPVQMDLAQFGSLPDIHFLGLKTGREYATLLASADLFLGASRYETFWLPPLEAMSCGVPVVVSEVGAVASFIPENGVQGVRLPLVVDDSAQLPEKMKRSSRPEQFLSGHRFCREAPAMLAEAALSLLADRQRRRAVGNAARDFVATAFGKERLADDLIKVFTTALDEKEDRPCCSRISSA